MLYRRAHVLDVNSMVNFLEKYHPKSVYRDIPFCRQSVIELCTVTIKSKSGVGFLCYDDDKELRGVLLGVEEPVFFNQNVNYATDLLFVAEAGGPGLLSRFFGWAKSRNVDRVIMGISTNDDRAEQFYEIMGMTRIGGMYVLH
jgi:hypothetical protein